MPSEDKILNLAGDTSLVSKVNVRLYRKYEVLHQRQLTALAAAARISDGAECVPGFKPYDVISLLQQDKSIISKAQQLKYRKQYELFLAYQQRLLLPTEDSQPPSATAKKTEDALQTSTSMLIGSALPAQERESDTNFIANLAKDSSLRFRGLISLNKRAEYAYFVKMQQIRNTPNFSPDKPMSAQNQIETSMNTLSAPESLAKDFSLPLKANRQAQIKAEICHEVIKSSAQTIYSNTAESAGNITKRTEIEPKSPNFLHNLSRDFSLLRKGLWPTLKVAECSYEKHKIQSRPKRAEKNTAPITPGSSQVLENQRKNIASESTEVKSITAKTESLVELEKQTLAEARQWLAQDLPLCRQSLMRFYKKAEELYERNKQHEKNKPPVLEVTKQEPVRLPVISQVQNMPRSFTENLAVDLSSKPQQAIYKKAEYNNELVNQHNRDSILKAAVRASGERQSVKDNQETSNLATNLAKDSSLMTALKRNIYRHTVNAYAIYKQQLVAKQLDINLNQELKELSANQTVSDASSSPTYHVAAVKEVVSNCGINEQKSNTSIQVKEQTESTEIKSENVEEDIPIVTAAETNSPCLTNKPDSVVLKSAAKHVEKNVSNSKSKSKNVNDARNSPKDSPLSARALKPANVKVKENMAEIEKPPTQIRSSPKPKVEAQKENLVAPKSAVHSSPINANSALKNKNKMAAVANVKKSNEISDAIKQHKGASEQPKFKSDAGKYEELAQIKNSQPQEHSNAEDNVRARKEPKEFKAPMETESPRKRNTKPVRSLPAKRAMPATRRADLLIGLYVAIFALISLSIACAIYAAVY